MNNSDIVFLANFSGSGSKLLQAQLSQNSKSIFTIPVYPLLYLYPHFHEWKKKYKKIKCKKTLSILLTKHKSLIDSRKIKGFNGLASLGKNKERIYNNFREKI